MLVDYVVEMPTKWFEIVFKFGKYESLEYCSSDFSVSVFLFPILGMAASMHTCQVLRF